MVQKDKLGKLWEYVERNEMKVAKRTISKCHVKINLEGKYENLFSFIYIKEKWNTICVV